MRLHVIYIFTHDSIGLGEDGPTHQPIEHLTSLRAIPNLTLIRPGDANEAAEAWRAAMTHTDGPVMLALSRQRLPTFDRAAMAPASELRRGAYVLTETAGKTPELILIATGSELQLAVGAKAELDSVLPRAINRRLAIEAGVSLSWYRWVGPDGDIIGMKTFGASAPSQDVLNHFGFTVENVVERALKLLTA
jgi:transketolase